MYHFGGTKLYAYRDAYNLHVIVYVLVLTGGAQPPQVTGWELALVSEASRAGNASPPNKRVHQSPTKVYSNDFLRQISSH